MRIGIQQISFAELEFQTQGIRLDDTMEAISVFLDRQKDIIEMIRHDIETGIKNTNTGRNGMNPDQILRSYVLMRIKNWDYRELRERIADGYTLRIFTRFWSGPVPKHDAFNRAFNKIRPSTLKAINEAIVKEAVRRGLENGAKLRVDTTVVETDIHYPTDSTLLWDCIRVISRWVDRIENELSIDLDFPDRTRRAKRRTQEISRMTPKARKRWQRRKYRELIGLAEEVVQKARAAAVKAGGVALPDAFQSLIVEQMIREIERLCHLADRVIDQSRRRVLQGEQVPPHEKLYSIFETHTDLIVRGKANKPIEFGHKVFLAESGIGLITQYSVLDGNPPDQAQVAPSLEGHKRTFKVSLDLYAGDRGFYSQENLDLCSIEGVKIECIPQRGGRRDPERVQYEKSKSFKRGQRFRSGIEGRISVLFRGRGMKRCLMQGKDRFEAYVGASVLANNLLVMGSLLSKKSSRVRS